MRYLRSVDHSPLVRRRYTPAEVEQIILDKHTTAETSEETAE